jgi:hypothetical protein
MGREMGRGGGAEKEGWHGARGGAWGQSRERGKAWGQSKRDGVGAEQINVRMHKCYPYAWGNMVLNMDGVGIGFIHPHIYVPPSTHPQRHPFITHLEAWIQIDFFIRKISIYQACMQN